MSLVLKSFAYIIGFLSLQHQSHAADYGADHREACRAAIAGHYIDAFDKELAERTIGQTLQDKQQKLHKGLTTTKAKIKNLKAQLRATEFDFNLEESLSAAQEMQKLITRSLQENDKLLTRHAQKLKAAQERKQELKKLMAPVFIIEDQDEKVGFKVRVSYRSACGKYQFMCPLPKKQRQALGRIVKPLPLACQRYGQMEVMYKQ